MHYIMENEKISEQEALSKCKAIVIHGDVISKKYTEQANLEDLDPEKGRYLVDWIKVPEVVFARTTPS